MRRLISLIVCIVLTVSVFTAAYATESMTGTSEEVAPIVEVVAKEGETTGEKSNGMTQTESDLAQTEINDQELRNTVLQYAKELAIKYYWAYFQMPDRKEIPNRFPFILDANVDQSIAFLQEKRAKCEAEIKRRIPELEKAINSPEIRDLLEKFPVILGKFLALLRLMPILKPLVFNMAYSAQYRALVEAKQHYDYRLNGIMDNCI